jgi:DNA-binding transcriptional ArsR family regulator
MITKAVLTAQVKEYWDGFAIKDLTDDAGKDARRAALLHEYHHKGLTARELAKAIKKTHPFVTYHLRYHRFLVTTVTDITERRFREYWHQCSDPLIMKGGRGKKIEATIKAHEDAVFPVIAAKVQAGELPVKFVKVVTPKTPEELAHVSNVLRALEKEYKEVYSPEFERITKELRALLTDSPVRYRPGHIAEYVRFFDEAVAKYHKLMTGLIKRVDAQASRRPARRAPTPHQPTLMTEGVN